MQRPPALLPPRDRPLHLPAALHALALAAAPAVIPAPLRAQEAAPPTAGAVRATIETNRAAYRAGDTVAVRVTLINEGPVPLTLNPVTPWRGVRLIVTGADGRVVPPTLPRDFRHYMSGRPFTLEPRDPLVLSFDQEAWVRLRFFGYAPLAPGRYTLTAIPLVGGPDVHQDFTTVRSNRPTITVAP